MGMKSRYTAWQRKAIRALTASIEHWERVAAGATRDGEGVCADSCACCDEWSNVDCDGCPIKARTGRRGCHGTPYYDAKMAFSARMRGVLYEQDDLDNQVTFLGETLAMVKLLDGAAAAGAKEEPK